MLVVPFVLHNTKYAICAAQIVEVVPHVELRQIPGAPEYVAGVFNYRGTIVPVIDLAHLLYGAGCSRSLGTRIILVAYPAAGAQHILGVLAERVIEAVKVPPERLSAPGVASAGSPYLGSIIMDGQDMMQIVEAQALLPEQLKNSLFLESRIVI